MPTIAHALIGGGLGMFLKSVTEKSEKQFKNQHLILLALNSFVGPDFPKIIYPFVDNLYQTSAFRYLNMLFHTVAGWFFAALLLAFLYFAIFKYATKEGKQGNPPLTFKSTYLVILAAGLLHFALDFVDYASYMTPNFSGEGSYGAFQLGYENLSTGYGMPEGILSSVFPGFSGGELLLIGLLSMVILIWVLNNKKLIVVYIAAGGFILFIITILILFGGRVVYYENDLGWLIYFLFFIMFPLYLIKFSLD